MTSWRLAIAAGILGFLCPVLARPLGPSAQSSPEFPSTSGNAFVRLCSAVSNDGNESRSDAVHIGACIGYLEGVIHGVLAEVAFARATSNSEPPQPFCPPGNT